jgi:hypothetical protein
MHQSIVNDQMQAIIVYVRVLSIAYSVNEINAQRDTPSEKPFADNGIERPILGLCSSRLLFYDNLPEPP